MNSQYVCLRCRLQIARRSSALGKASFVSLGTLVNNEESGDSAARELTRKKDTKRMPVVSSDSVPQRQRYLKGTQYQHTEVDRVLETLFVSNQRNTPPPLVSRYSQTRIGKPSDLTAFQDNPEVPFETLRQKLYTERAPLEEVWGLCLDLLGDGQKESIPKEQVTNVRARWIENMFADILLVASRSHPTGPASSSLTTPAQIIRVYNTHGLMRYWWDQTLWGRLGSLMKLRYTSGGCLLQEADGIIKEILEIWRLFFERHGCPAISPVRQDVIDGLEPNISASQLIPMQMHSEPKGWRGLPSTSDLVSTSANLPVEPVDRLLYLLPRHPNNRQAIRTSAAAVMTVDCIQWLSELEQAERSDLADAEPFVMFVKYLGRESKIQRQAATKCLLDEGLPREIIQKSLAGWGRVPKKASEGRRLQPVKQNNQEKDPNLPGIGDTLLMAKKALNSDSPQEDIRTISAPRANALSEDSVWEKSKVTSLSIDLHQAIDRSDTACATGLWQTFQNKLTVDNGNERVREELFAQFLSAFFALRRSEQAVGVWNHMVRLGHKPTAKHWHAMIVGCTKSKDLISMQQIWSNMLAAGIEPDMLLWTARINGLIICRKWQLGLQALEELGRVWKSEVTKPPEHRSKNDAASPSIIPIKAAVHGLISIGKPDIAQSVLDWTKAHNIPLDTPTFNILLRPAVRASNTAEVQTILSQMHAHSCSPDVATFTIIINGLLSNPSSSFQPQSVSDQHAAVSKIFADMEAAGLKANAYTYGTMLHGLLADFPLVKIPAARAVLDHMAANKVKPSPHVYTILITHYFSTSPPDLAAIDGIWRRIRLEQAVLDGVFYDRMIENYARVGEIDKMLYFLRRMPQEGKSPSWVALEAALRALVKAEEWDHVRELIRDVEDESEGLMRYGTRAWRGQEEFGELVGEVKGMSEMKVI